MLEDATFPLVLSSKKGDLSDLIVRGVVLCSQHTYGEIFNLLSASP